MGRKKARELRTNRCVEVLVDRRWRARRHFNALGALDRSARFPALTLWVPNPRLQQNLCFYHHL